jgi:phenylalanyl-tRNA synthetase alpha chain
MRLPERQLAVLEAASATDERTMDEIATETGLKPETVVGAAFDLRDEGLLSVAERTAETLDLTDEGRRYVDDGLPETRLYRAGLALGADEEPVSMGRVIGEAELDGPEVDIALSNFARKGFGSIDAGELTVDGDADPDADPEATALAALAEGDDPAVDDAVVEQLASRGLVDRRESATPSATPT